MNVAKYHRKKDLLLALKEAGLPYTMINFVTKYENITCNEEGCPHKGKTFLASPRNENGDRIYTIAQIREIISVAKEGWWKKHWHFLPN
jgi:hypothetical protein